MTGSQRLLIFGGMALAAFGMLYGLHYAALVEHRMLDRLGGSLAQAFTDAAARNSASSQAALESYRSTKYDYVRQVDAHSHWIGLAMTMIVLGAAFGHVHYTESLRRTIALALLAGGTLFPLSVILQTYQHDAVLLKALAVASSGLVIVSMAAVAWGFFRRTTSA